MQAEIQDIVKIGYLNGLFVLARSIGLIGHALDQKRLQQGLYRHPWDEVKHSCCICPAQSCMLHLAMIEHLCDVPDLCVIFCRFYTQSKRSPAVDAAPSLCTNLPRCVQGTVSSGVQGLAVFAMRPTQSLVSRFRNKKEQEGATCLKKCLAESRQTCDSDTARAHRSCASLCPIG